MRASRTGLLPLFLVSLSAVGYEIALTRYFAVAKWSEYGYWVISIVMVGFALSGVALALFRAAAVRNASWLMPALPALLIVAAALGYHLTTTNPFNPLQLQNAATYTPQLGNIGAYYACLLPFFFLAGLFVSLSFVLHADEIGRVYGYDLTGAGAGALLVLGLMAVLHPFSLVPALLVPLALAAAFVPGRARLRAVVAACAALLAAEALLLLDGRAEINDFKAIYAPAHTPGARVLAEIRSPRGDYTLLDDFTERVDTDVSNDAGLLGLPGPPRAFGLYRDGNRIAALPMPGRMDVGYAGAALDALPYTLIPHARVLLAGASGGFRIEEALALGAAHVDASEPEPVLRGALLNGLGPSPARPADARVRVLAESPLAAVRRGDIYDLIDVSADFLDAAEANATALTADAIAAYLAHLSPQGIVSLPVPIRDFPVYAARMLATVRAALLRAGIGEPADHVVVYRSAWSVRVLVSPAAWSEDRIAAMRAFCDARSFDVSYYPGFDVVPAREKIYNDLPATSFDAGEVANTGPDDAVADEARAVLDGAPTASAATFDLTPATLDRPAFFAVLRLAHLDTLLRRIEVLPQAEIGALVNVAVLAQSVVLACLVLLVPLLAPGRVRAERTGVMLPAIYFAALGLGFLFIEIYLIEKASLYLADRASAFALVLTAMLIFSGIGAMAAGRLSRAPRRGAAFACLAAMAWCALAWAGLEPAILATLGLPLAARVVLLLAVIAPVSVALGLPFPLGLARAGTGGFLPWAWALNGAFSVVATPLANLIAREAGFSRVLLGALVLYGVALIAFPTAKKVRQWQDVPAPSRVAD